MVLQVAQLMAQRGRTERDGRAWAIRYWSSCCHEASGNDEVGGYAHGEMVDSGNKRTK